MISQIKQATDFGKIFHPGVGFSGVALSYARVSARQTALEPAASGVDLARSWSCWARFTNLRHNAQRLFTCADSVLVQNQFSCFIIDRGNQSSVTNSKLRFLMYTSSANFIYIQSTNPLLYNRFYHIVITKSATEANTAFEMYINGVRDTTATRNLTGTYTGAVSHADLRFKISHEHETGAWGGNIRDLALWDKVLNQTEVTELYNSGYPRANASASFYANIISDWPLHSDLESIQNSNYDLTTTAGTIAHGYFAFEPSWSPFAWQRAEIGSTRYIAFGQSVQKDASTVSWFGRSGTSHLANGKIVRVDVNISTQVASAPVDVITDGTYDLRGGSAGIDDNGHIHVFSSRYNTGTDTFIDTGKYTSTDGGATFGAITTFAVTETRFNFFGKHFRGSASGEFFVPFFEHDGTNYLVSIFKTTDNWSTNSKITVYSGLTFYGELSVVNINGTMVGLMRKTGGGSGIYQVNSADNGATWSAPVLTNLAGSSDDSNCDVIVAPTGKLSVLFMDRGQLYAFVSIENVMADVIADPTAWKTPGHTLAPYSTDALGILGYPVLHLLPDGRYVAFMSLEQASSRADLYFAIGSIQ